MHPWADCELISEKQSYPSSHIYCRKWAFHNTLEQGVELNINLLGGGTRYTICTWFSAKHIHLDNRLTVPHKFRRQVWKFTFLYRHPNFELQYWLQSRLLCEISLRILVMCVYPLTEKYILVINHSFFPTIHFQLKKNHSVTFLSWKDCYLISYTYASRR